MSSGSDATEDGFAPTLRAGDVVAEKYRVEKLLGSGGMAEVYAAVNLLTEKRVALKLILPALSRINEVPTRFRREALAAGRIHHPNVVTIFDAVEHRESTCLVMELLEGETLAKRLERTPQLPLVEVIALILPAMRGVAAAHEHGVVHRDLKPENIFITLDDEGLARGCKVLDFGVSKLSRALDVSLDITRAGNLVGTPMYMAPEQVRGSHDVDHRMDVYSIGVVLYEMIAGRPPFTGEVYSALMVQIATTDPPPLSQFRLGVPRRITEIVARALERDVNRRFPDMLSFIRALEDAARDELHLTVGTPPQGLVTELSAPRPAMLFPTEPVVAARVSSRSRWLVLGAGIAIGVAVLVFWRWWQSDGKSIASIASSPVASSPGAHATPGPPPAAAAGDTARAASGPPGAPSALTGVVVEPEAPPARGAAPDPYAAHREREPARQGPPAMLASDGKSPRPDSLKRAAWRPHTQPGPPEVPPDLPVSSSVPARVPRGDQTRPSPSTTRPLRAGKLTVEDF